MKWKMEKFRIELQRYIEDSSQLIKNIYREEAISLHTNLPEITRLMPMSHEMKIS